MTDAVLALQRTAGNRAVGRILYRDPVATGEDATASPIAGGFNPLVGLKTDDGLTPDTVGLRPLVVQLQQELNRHMNSKLKLDGKFGPHTTRVLAEFQESIRIPSANPVDQTTADALLFDIPPGAQSPADPAPFNAAVIASEGLRGAGLDAGASSTGYVLMTSSLPVIKSGALAQLIGVSSSLREVARLFGVAADLMSSLIASPVLGNPLVGLILGDGFGSTRLEDRRDRVKLLQRILNDKTSAKLAGDGRFGGDTLQALNSFQTNNGLLVQPRVDADCADLLLGRTAADTTLDLTVIGALFTNAGTSQQAVATALTGTFALGQGGALAAAAEQSEAEHLSGVGLALAPLANPTPARSVAAHQLGSIFAAISNGLSQVSGGVTLAGTQLRVEASNPDDPDPGALVSGDALIAAGPAYQAVAQGFAQLALVFLAA